MTSPIDTPKGQDLLQEHLPGINGKGLYKFLEQKLGPATTTTTERVTTPYIGRRMQQERVHHAEPVDLQFSNPAIQGKMRYVGDTIRIEISYLPTHGENVGGEDLETWILKSDGTLAARFRHFEANSNESKAEERPVISLNQILVAIDKDYAKKCETKTATHRVRETRAECSKVLGIAA